MSEIAAAEAAVQETAKAAAAAALSQKDTEASTSTGAGTSPCSILGIIPCVCLATSLLTALVHFSLLHVSHTGDITSTLTVLPGCWRPAGARVFTTCYGGAGTSNPAGTPSPPKKQAGGKKKGKKAKGKGKK